MKKRMGHKGRKKEHHDANIVAVMVNENRKSNID